MDLSDLGFKCGIEIHQRLNTKKLFCECHCDPNKEELNETTRISRKLRATVGELGKFDPAAAFEAAKGKNFIYIVDDKTSCAVEADEEPPHRMNSDALEVALTVSKLLNSRIIDDIFVMRKTVIDGSAVSGFQRTALISLDGKILTSKGEIPVPTLALEEESSGIVEKTGIEGEITYRLDRQGIPLIEIATSPDLKDGIHAMETAEKIGALLRSTGKVQRGLGSIRQDLNISISQGARVEIKGVQELRLIPKLVDNEVARQIGLLKIREQLRERHVLLGEEHFHLKDLTHTFKITGCKLIKDGLQRKEHVIGLKLQSFSSLFKQEIMPSYRLGTEIAAYVRQKSLAKGIIHSDEALEEKYGFSVSEINALEKELNINTSNNDLFVLCVGTEETCKKALRAVFERCMQLQAGVPEETRRAEGEISIYMRPLPGSQRMYPETDLPPIIVTKEMLDLAEKSKPESMDAKKAKYAKWGLNEQLASKMVKSPEWEKFESLASTDPKNAPIIAITLLESLISIKREGFNIEKLQNSDLSGIFKLYSLNLLTKAAIPGLLKLKISNYSSKPEELLSIHTEIKRLSESELRKIISQLEGTPEKKFAEIMKRHRLTADAQQLKALLEGK